MQEFLEESWKSKETDCHSDFNEKLPINTDMKNSKVLKN